MATITQHFQTKKSNRNVKSNKETAVDSVKSESVKGKWPISKSKDKTTVLK